MLWPTRSADSMVRDLSRESRASSSSKRAKPHASRRTTHVSLLTTLFACAALIVSVLRRHVAPAASRRDPRRAHLFSFASHASVVPTAAAAQVQVQAQAHAQAQATTATQKRNLDLHGVPEALTTIRQDWKVVLNNFLDDSDPHTFSARKIRQHYYSDINNVQSTCMLVTIKNGNITFQEKYRENQHSRASSVKHVLRKIMREKAAAVPAATFMVMLSDGHRPQVATFGSARHWKGWNMLTPVPLGNSRGTNVEWGTPFEGWNSYIDNTIVSKHANYSWNEKFEKALFRGSLSMQKFKLGSCNEENGGRCERAQKWNEVNRGVMYERAKQAPDLFDVGFTQLKKKEDGPAKCLDDAPQVRESIKFADFQKFKYILNVGNNQDWAERLRSLLYMNSVIIVHQAETQEFFTPLMRPWVHFLPTNLMMTDLITNVQWARENDAYTQQIVRNQNAFADRYITERSMQQYWEVALEEFGARQRRAAGEGSGSAY